MSIYLVTVKYQNATGNQFRNTMHYEFPSYVPSTVEIQEFVDNFALRWNARIIPHQGSNITSYAIDMRRVDVGDLPTIEYVPATWPISGALADSLLPLQNAALVSWIAPTEFPRNARNYIGGLTELDNSSGGQPVASLRTDLDLYGTEQEVVFITGQVDAQLTAVRYGGDPRAVIANNLVFFRRSDTEFRTQRRRVRGVGI